MRAFVVVLLSEKCLIGRIRYLTIYLYDILDQLLHWFKKLLLPVRLSYYLNHNFLLELYEHSNNTLTSVFTRLCF